MSNRSLIEINHDFWSCIDEADTVFVFDLLSYLRVGDKKSTEALEKYGIRIIGMRHHSEPFHVEWGHHTMEQP